jgi:16S rRNA (guanine527-N7)-methyltransferase
MNAQAAPERRGAARSDDGQALRALLDGGLAQLGLALGPEQRERLLAYVSLLEKWNRVYNLTAVREPARMVTHHLLDSLAVLRSLEARAGAEAIRVLDVGSGGGLPGIPLAIARPKWHVVMLEPVHKKGAFLTQAIAELGLANAEAAIVRVEEFRPTRPFAIVISRAFADLATFAQSSARHVAVDGNLVAMKGVHPDEELSELPDAFAVRATQRLDVPGVEGARHLVVMQRV